MNSTEFVNTAETWQTLIFGVFGSSIVLPAVADARWQSVRLSMKGTSMAERFSTLTSYLQAESYSMPAKVRVTNYVYALKRGGMFK